ncbi:putative tachykinin family protein [Phaeomoniella chlamydospora]|uniref:Putative tachykinin family protein n=1 Tax=Phaeomoniella chlamydospora TaxID=158046 RepID=A0A0G2GCZ5_PHACM|nr:putative tachykinin family protein [Phaeomoniella chlamydospora]
MLVGGPAMIYGICGLAAAHQHSMRGRLNSGYVECESDIELLDILYYKGKILSELQRCLVGEVMCEPSGLVAAVGLIAMEILCGNKEELRLHMQGLEALLRVRGGWLDVPANVSYVWLVSTYIAAVWTNSVPPSAPSLSPELLIHTEELKRRKAPAISKDMMSNYTKVGASLDPELQKLIVSVRDLIIYREICHAQPEPLSAEQTEQITALRLNVEYRIMFRLFSHAPYIPGDPSDKIQTTRSQKAVLASLLIFSLTSMMILKHSSAPIRNLAKVLKTNLPSMDSTPSAIFPPALEIILWTLFLGAHITLDSDDDGGGSRGWYISRINRVAELLGLRRWETVKSALERCFYVERIYGVSFRGIWNGVLLEREKVLKGLV